MPFKPAEGAISKELDRRLSEFIEINDFQEAYKLYKWSSTGVDNYKAGFPAIRALEKIVPDSFKTRTFSSGHAFMVKAWGTPDQVELRRVRENLDIKNTVDICRALYDDNGGVTNIVKNNPEKLAQTLAMNSTLSPVYITKILRFACPEEYGVIDSIIARKYGSDGKNWLKINVKVGVISGKKVSYLNKTSDWLSEYSKWIMILRSLSSKLQTADIKCPYPEEYFKEGIRNDDSIWFCSDVEMALFFLVVKKEAAIEARPVDIPSTSEPPAKTKFVKCPLCGSNLVQRIADRTGEKYWGCSNYTGECRYNTRSY